MSDEMSEIWDLYADDGGQSLDTVEEVLLALRDHAADADAIGRLFRAMHTFKGNSRVLGLSVVEGLAHLGEDLIGLVRDEGVPLDEEMVTLLLEAADLLRGLMEQTLTLRHDVDPALTVELGGRLRDKAARCKQGGDAAAAGQSLPIDVPSSPSSPVETTDEAPFFPPVDENSSAETPAQEAVEPDSSPAELIDAVIFEQQPRRRLADDPTYRDMFLSMVGDILKEMRRIVDSFAEDAEAGKAAVVDAVQRLFQAAEQIRMREWPNQLSAIEAAPPTTAEELEAVIASLQSLYDRDIERLRAELAGQAAVGEPEPAVSTRLIGEFYVGIDPLLSSLADMGARLSANEEVPISEIEALAEEICILAEPLGYVRLMDTANMLPIAAGNLEDFRNTQFQLYEELNSIEELTQAAGLEGEGIAAASILGNWCAETVFEVLLAIHNTIEGMKHGERVDGVGTRLMNMMRRVYHACRYYSLGSAAHLCMSLVDLIARSQQNDCPLDPVLLPVLKSFLSVMELVFDTLNVGDAPDMVAVEALLRDASLVSFSSSGTLSSSVIEARLGLPRSFHKVLTPESVKIAVKDLDAGKRFYIIRADLNQDEEIAAAFLDWVGTGAADVISNVTVFEEKITLFDFLIATSMGEVQLVEALSSIDSSAKKLFVQKVLTDRRIDVDSPAGETAAQNEGAGTSTEGMPAAEALTSDMMEVIGEIVTGQAMVRHAMAAIADEDIFRILDGEVRAAGGDWGAAKSSVRQYLQDYQERMERLLQSETQLSGRLDWLQEEAIAVRTRSAALLLRPLAPYGESMARQRDREVAIVFSGEDTMLDYKMIDSLKGPLRSLLAFCIEESVESRNERAAKGKVGSAVIHVDLRQNENHLTVAVEDDGKGIDLDRVRSRAAQMGFANESDPLSLITHNSFGRFSNSDDGVGTDFVEIHSALRRQGGDLRIASNPSGGCRFSITMPLSMVVLDGMVVRVEDVMYVVPIDAIRQIVHADVASLVRVSADDDGLMLQLSSDDVIPVQFLIGKGQGSFGVPESFIGLHTGDASDEHSGADAKKLFIVAGKGKRRVAISVDELIGQQLVLLRPLQGYLSAMRGVTGCALLGSGGVGMVLDLNHVLGQG